MPYYTNSNQYNFLLGFSGDLVCITTATTPAFSLSTSASSGGLYSHQQQQLQNSLFAGGLNSKFGRQYQQSNLFKFDNLRDPINANTTSMTFGGELILGQIQQQQQQQQANPRQQSPFRFCGTKP